MVISSKYDMYIVFLEIIYFVLRTKKLDNTVKYHLYKKVYCVTNSVIIK